MAGAIGRAEFLEAVLGTGLGMSWLAPGGLAEQAGAVQAPHVFDVRNFGAKGDGVSDDARAIQATIDAVPRGTGVLGVAPYTAGGVVYLPASPRPYLIGATLAIAKGVVLRGDGPGSMLYLADGANVPMIRITHGADTWAVVAWLSLEGNRFNQAKANCHGVLVQAASPLARYHDLFWGLYVRNCRGNGFEFIRGAPHRIVDCTFHDNSGAQIHHGPEAVDNYIVNTIVGTDAGEPGAVGWWCEGSNNVWIGGAAARCGVGMCVSGLRNAVGGGTSVDSNLRHGVVLEANETRLNGLVFRNNSTSQTGGFDDVLIDGTSGKGQRNVISGCVIDGASLRTEPGEPQGRFGVEETGGAAGNRVTGCAIIGHTAGDVCLTGAGSFADHRVGLVEVPYAPVLTLDAQKGATWVVRLGGDVAASSIVNGMRAQRIVLVLAQDQRGGRRFAWPANVRLAGGQLPLSEANRMDVVTLEYDGQYWLEVGRSLGL